jgi:hypothetical protein
MKTFTVKDFIIYNNPCFSCGSKISFKIGSTHNELSFSPVYKKTTVTADHVEIDLDITYRQTFKLYIVNKSNKILSPDMKSLTDYLSMHELFLSSRCDRCYTSIESYPLEFNLAKGFIKPVGINQENLIVTDDKNMYQIHSSFNQKISTATISKINKTMPISPARINLPLLPLYKIKNRDRLINKLKTLVLFS